jgi:GH25 family lysozyme M1 (1,4-beta-N-acetylmuramidase)
MRLFPSVILATSLVPAMLLAPVANAQRVEDTATSGDRRELGGPPPLSFERAAPRPKFVLDAEQRRKFGGVFGINFSHWDFDIRGDNCDTQGAYNTARCSCSIDWNAIVNHGLRFAYFKASDGDDVDLAFARNWSQTQKLHAAGRLYRGAYHFFQPDVDPDTQAEVFLKAIGATGNTRPQQLPPVLDIEWAYRRVEEGSDDFKACPKYRLKQLPSGRYRCDSWHKISPPDIVKKAQRWISIVEKATGRPVIIYTNVIGWWNPNIGAAGTPLTGRQAIWLSAYPPAGPQYDEKWTNMNGSKRWSMPPLPIGASYKPDRYDVAHFWQFTESGRVPDMVYTCNGRRVAKDMELNWVPVDAGQFPKLFGVAAPPAAGGKRAGR